MNRQTVLLLVAGGIAAMTVVLMHNRLAEAPAPAAAPVQATRVVIAKRDLALGSFVQSAQDLDWGTPPAEPVTNVPAAPEGAPESTPAPAAAAVPVNVPKENYLYEGSVKLTDFNGAVVRRALHAGDPVPQQALMKSGEGGFMSAVLEPGMRAVSIGVNATSGNAGFVSPGDHVDLIVTHHIKTSTGSNNQQEESVVSETFVHNVRVVAVDQMLDNPENKAILAKTITVEVSPRQAEEVAVAAEMGKISLALRSTAPMEAKPEAKQTPDAAPMSDKDRAMSELYGTEKDSDQSRVMDFTRDSDLSQLLGHKSIVVPRVQVIHGDKTENLDFYQEMK